DGKRIKKIVPMAVAPFNDEVTVFVYDAGGKLVAEYATVISQDPKVSYTTADHLGSPRILTDENGDTISRRDLHPFGEEILTTHRDADLGYTPDDVRQKFTTYVRDAETNLDYAKARTSNYYLGRFTSPDPLLSSGRVEIPQSWNRYSYVLSNPLSFTDPLGLFVWSAELGGDTTNEEFEVELEGLRGSRKGKSRKEKKLINKEINRMKTVLNRRKAFTNDKREARSAVAGLSGEQKRAAKRTLDNYASEHEATGAVITLRE